MIEQLSLAYLILILHTIVVGITVAGGIAIFTGRFAKFHKKDVFVYLFIVCAFGQIISLLFTGGCILTDWERDIRKQINPNSKYSKTFLEEYVPFLQDSVIQKIPMLTLGALTGAIIQISIAIRKKKKIEYNNI